MCRLMPVASHAPLAHAHCRALLSNNTEPWLTAPWHTLPINLNLLNRKLVEALIIKLQHTTPHYASVSSAALCNNTAHSHSITNLTIPTSTHCRVLKWHSSWGSSNEWDLLPLGSRVQILPTLFFPTRLANTVLDIIPALFGEDFTQVSLHCLTCSFCGSEGGKVYPQSEHSCESQGHAQ